jgi:hypothetical protein
MRPIKKTTNQLQFIFDTHNMGEKNKHNKLLPIQANRLMKQVGTAEGQTMLRSLAKGSVLPLSFQQTNSGYKLFAMNDVLSIAKLKGQHPTVDTRHPSLKTQHPSVNTQHSTFNIQHFTLNT